MSSLQQSAPGSKSAKFVSSNNPLDPILKPFGSDPSDEEDDFQKQMAENVNQRLQNTIRDLKQKHATGQNEVDHPDRAPTGPIYQAIRAQQEQAAAQHKQQSQRQQQQQDSLLQQQLNHLALETDGDQDTNDNDNDDSDDDDDLLLDDPALEELRERRIAELKRQHETQLQHLAAGHGQYRTISQDEFLPECNCPSTTVVHFAHDEFERCQIMDQHLTSLSQQYVECKFVRILAPKAPFFVTKLSVQTLPTLLIFEQGKLIHRLVGFEGLTSSSSNNPDQFETWRLAQWLADHSNHSIRYKGPVGHERDELLQQKAAQQRSGGGGGTVYRGGYLGDDLED